MFNYVIKCSIISKLYYEIELGMGHPILRSHEPSTSAVNSRHTEKFSLIGISLQINWKNIFTPIN